MKKVYLPPCDDGRNLVQYGWSEGKGPRSNDKDKGQVKAMHNYYNDEIHAEARRKREGEIRRRKAGEIVGGIILAAIALGCFAVMQIAYGIW